IARDGIGNIFVSGSELRTAGGGAVNADAVVVSLDSTATSTTTQFVGGPGDDFGLRLAGDETRNGFPGRGPPPPDLPGAGPAVRTTFGGTTDAFVVMITQPGVSAAAGGGHSSTCFIATAAFGSPMAREVGVLREFRDDVLLPHAAGRAAVAAYHTIGPPLAGMIAQSETLKAVVRASLAPMIWLAPLARGRATLAFYVVIGAGSLLAGLLR